MTISIINPAQNDTTATTTKGNVTEEGNVTTKENVTCVTDAMSETEVETPETLPAKNDSMYYHGMDKELQLLELEIRKGLRSFVTVGHNLGVIQDKELYKTRGYTTFELYCKEVFDFTRQQGYRLIRASKIYAMLKDSYKGGKLPQTESQCRPLTSPDLNDLDITLIWAIVVESGKITAVSIDKAIKEYRGDGYNTDSNQLVTPKVEAKENVSKETGSKEPNLNVSCDTDQADDTENLPFTPDSEKTGVSVQGAGSTPEKGVNNATDKVDTKGSSTEPVTDGTKPERHECDGTKPESKGDLIAENLLLKAQIQELELKLAQAKMAQGKGTVPQSKMALQLFKTGYNVLLKTVSEDQKAELTDLYNSLTGRK